MFVLVASQVALGFYMECCSHRMLFTENRDEGVDIRKNMIQILLFCNMIKP